MYRCITLFVNCQLLSFASPRRMRSCRVRQSPRSPHTRAEAVCRPAREDWRTRRTLALRVAPAVPWRQCRPRPPCAAPRPRARGIEVRWLTRPAARSPAPPRTREKLGEAAATDRPVCRRPTDGGARGSACALHRQPALLGDRLVSELRFPSPVDNLDAGAGETPRSLLAWRWARRDALCVRFGRPNQRTAKRAG